MGSQFKKDKMCLGERRMEDEVQDGKEEKILSFLFPFKKVNKGERN